MDSSFDWKKIPIIILGNAVYGLGVVAFIVPNHLMTGGSTGLALFFQHLFGIPINAFVGGFNVIMFLLGLFIMGKRFALTTLVSTFVYPIILTVYQQIPQLGQLTRNPVLGVVYGGGMIGLGIGLVLRQGASTGGMDIPPLVLNKKFGLSISFMLYLFDSGILLLQMFKATGEEILYGILVVMTYTFVLDKVLLIGKGQTQVKIISEKYEPINDAIQNVLDRGSTLVKSVGGHLKQEQYMILSVISNRELSRLSQMVKDIDPKAFLIVNRVKEVRGRGFTMEKEYHEIKQKNEKNNRVNQTKSS